MPRSKSSVIVSSKEKFTQSQVNEEKQSQSSQEDSIPPESLRRADSIAIAKKKSRVIRSQELESSTTSVENPVQNGLASMKTSEGELQIELLAKDATNECKSFIELCNEGTYDFSSISRIIPGFMIQVGKKSDKQPQTPKKTERNQTLSFNKMGIVGFNKDGEIIISLGICNALDSKCNIFGQISQSSMDILKQISQLETDTNDFPVYPITVSSIQIIENPFPSSEESSPQSKRRRISFGKQTKSHDGQKGNSTPLVDFSKSLKRGGTVVLDEQQAYKSFLSMDDAVLTSSPSLGGRSMSLPNIPKVLQKVRPRYPKRLVIIRHGQSEQNAALDLMDPDINALASIRDADIRLTELGKWQAVETGKFLASSEQFDICFSSPYDRAIQTAEHIISQFPYKLRIYKDNCLREKEFGRLHGLLRQRDGSYWYRFPGGENYPAVEQRVQLFLEKICRDYAARSVLVVTHQVPYKLFRAIFQYLDEKGVLELDAVPNCGIQEYVLDRLKTPEGRMRLKTWNYVSYDMKNAPVKNVLPPVTRSLSRKKSEFRNDSKIEIDGNSNSKQEE